MLNRRQFLENVSGAALLSAVPVPLSALAKAQAPASDHTLRIAPLTLDIGRGVAVKTIAYNGQVPGPLFRLTEGVPVTIDVTNTLPYPEIVHWHGLTVGTVPDGAHEEGAPMIKPGSTLRYSFTPRPVGTRWYHTHAMAMDDLSRAAYTGQFGFLLVDSASQPTPKVDYEFQLAVHHWEPSPASIIPGEVTSRTQPIPLAPGPFARQRLTADMLTTRTPAAHAWAAEEFATFRSDGLFIPFATDRPTVVFPGFDGGAEWGGSAADAHAGILYVNANDLAWTGILSESKPSSSPGELVYSTQCAICHGGDRAGSPPTFPSLVHVDKRLTQAQIVETIHNGKGRMPGFPAIQDARLTALLDFVAHGGSGIPSMASPSANGGTDPLGARLYSKDCAICHGDDRLGAPSNYPGLLGVHARLTDVQILSNIQNGKGRMPGFPSLTPADSAALLRYLGPPMDAPARQSDKAELESNTSAAPRFRFGGYRKFLDPDGYPAVAPPWGTLNAIDLNTGKYLLEGSPRQLSRACGQGRLRYRDGKLRRPRLDREWRSLHWRNCLRSPVARFRRPHRRTALAGQSPLRR